MEIVEKYFTSLTSEQKNRFIQLGSLYSTWNEKINIISRKDIDQLYLRHVLHSLSIAKYISITQGMRVLDIGTGGGFPGIPLAILFPEANFTLVDSTQKKIKVVNAVADALDLNNVKVIHNRAENITGKFDIVVCRAVAHLSQLIQLTKKNIARPSGKNTAHGLIALKGGDLSAEISTVSKAKLIDIKDYFDEEFFQTKKIVHVTFV